MEIDEQTQTLIAFVKAGGEVNADTGDAFLMDSLALRLDGKVRVPPRGELFAAMSAMLHEPPEPSPAT